MDFIISRRLLIASAANTIAFRAAFADSVSYAASDISHRHKRNVAVAKALAAQTPVATTQATFGLNHVIGYGQSEGSSFQSTPALTLTQPLDNVMLGRATHPMGSASGVDTLYNGRFVPVGDGNLHPLVGINQSAETGALISARSGEATGLTVGTSGPNTFSFTGFDPTTFCKPGDIVAFRGFAGTAAPLNVDSVPSENRWYSVTQVTPSSITVAQPLATSAAAASGISLFLLFIAEIGEDWLVEALNFWRRQQLAASGMAGNPTHLLVATNNAIGGKTVFDLAKPPRQFASFKAQGITITAAAKTIACSGMDFTQALEVGDTFEVSGFGGPYTAFNRRTYTATAVAPTLLTVDKLPPMDVTTPLSNISFSQPPIYFNSMADAIGRIEAIASAQGITAGLVAIVWMQGNADAVFGTPKALYKSALQQLQSDISAAAQAAPPNGYGQATPPWFLTFQSSGDDAEQRTGTGFPIAMAQLELATPVLTGSGPVSPTWVMVGPAYAVSRAGLHYDDNGYRWWGAMVGKVLHKVVDLRQTWYPIYPL